jgi:hypothetical protein
MAALQSLPGLSALHGPKTLHKKKGTTLPQAKNAFSRKSATVFAIAANSWYYSVRWI